MFIYIEPRSEERVHIRDPNTDHLDVPGLRSGFARRIRQLRKKNRALLVLLGAAHLYGALVTLSAVSPAPLRAQVEKGRAFRFTHKVKKATPYYRRLQAAEGERGVLKEGSQVRAEVEGGKARIWLEAEVNSGSLEPL
jgi:hypothetical protein